MGEKETLPEAMQALYSKTRKTVIVTKGAEGALLLNGLDTPLHLPGTPVSHVADTIGAGDAHAGAVLLALSRNQPLPDAVAFANRVAAQVVAQTGATLDDDGILREL
jgi:sugar/nucleoside kinase (ribokinase family)